jgi:phospholipid/cholesterol/gamma-HCH transport system substrate-binding protein
MQDSRINYVVVGAFVTAMVVAFVIVISVLSGRTGATDSYYTIYDNVTGLKYGTAVLYEGYQIGQVESIEPVAGGAADKRGMLFKVILEVQRGWRIPEDSVARATVSGLLSAMTIDIRGGQSERAIPPGGQIRGVSATNFFATFAELGAQFGDLSNESLKPMLANLNNLIRNIDRSTNESLPVILKDLQVIVAALAKDAPQIASSLRRSSETLEKDLLSPANVNRVENTLANIEETTANVARLSRDLDETRKAINQASAAINKVITDNAGNMDEAIRDLRYTLDTAARYVDDIAQNAATTSRNMAEFSRQIRDNPGLFLRGSPPPDQAAQGRR